MKTDFEALCTKEEALKRLFAGWTPAPRTEMVSLEAAAGRVLAEDQISMYQIPVCRASAMDGVAISYAQVKGGIPNTALWREGEEFVLADTGDDFPDEYDTVIPIEEVTLLPKGGLKFTPGLEIRQGMNVRPAGSQLEKGVCVAHRGTKLNAMDLAAIGMAGHTRVPVVAKPLVAFIPTGSELVPVGQPLSRGQNFDANSLMIAQLLRDAGAEPMVTPIVRDDRAELKQRLEQLVDRVDLILLNAGTSRGGEDFCGRLLEEYGALFHGVAAVPGRPMGAAILRGTPVINLSGPPLAAFHGFDWAVRPLIYHFLGIPMPERETVEATLTADLRMPEKLSMMHRISVTEAVDGSLIATPVGGRGGGNLPGALTSNGVYITRAGEPPLETGDVIQVELLRDKGSIRQQWMD